ncbi:MAG: type I glyceraldehyde-3-phosphate dehydrogenase [Acidimicrobiales bacterium]
MTVRVGINGFGRIGRNFLRAVIRRDADVELVAVNDLTSPEIHAQLLRYDSTHGPLGIPVSVDGGALVVGERRFQVLCERNPADLPWEALGAEIVIESTGIFTSRAEASAHLKAGAERVVISAPSNDADATFIIGVNDSAYDPDLHQVVSNASCTTNCFVPMVKVVEDAFGVTGGLMTTVHAYTNDQNILDLPHADPRRARAAAINIVPAGTGAARSTRLVLPQMDGKLDGSALRVPVPCGSITDFTAVVPVAADVAQINEAFMAASRSGPLAGVLDYTDDPIVSSDILGNPASCIFDESLTFALALGDGQTLLKVHGWYDNEWGYSNRLVDLVQVLSKAR